MDKVASRKFVFWLTAVFFFGVFFGGAIIYLFMPISCGGGNDEIVLFDLPVKFDGNQLVAFKNTLVKVGARTKQIGFVSREPRYGQSGEILKVRVKEKGGGTPYDFECPIPETVLPSYGTGMDFIQDLECIGKRVDVQSLQDLPAVYYSSHNCLESDCFKGEYIWTELK